MKPFLAALLTAGLLALTACARTESPETATTAVVVDDSTPQDGGTLIRRIESDLNTLNFVMHNSADEKNVLSYLYDGLVEFDENLQIVPGLAEKWEVSGDGKTYTFHLNPLATFEDGVPVKASDVLFTLKKIVDPASESLQLAGLFEGFNLARSRAIDDRTVSIAFDRPKASQLLSFSIAVIPEHIYSKGDFKKDFQWKVVGNGPYKLVRRTAGKEILLRRREDYWRKRPHLDSILFKVIEDDGVAWNAMKRGDIDEMRMNSDQWNLERASPLVEKTIDIHRFYYLGYNFIPWNTRDPILSDKRVRRALAMCLDRTAIINNLYYGTARIITGPFTPDQWAYNPSVEPIQFNPVAAQALLGVAGWKDTDADGLLDKDGKPFQLEFLIKCGNKTSTDQGQIYQEALKKIGVKVTIPCVDGATWQSRIQSGKYQATFLAWNLDADPDVFTLFHSSQFPPNGQNFVYYSNPEVDSLIEEGRVELDLARRTEIYHRLHAALAEDQPYHWTVQVSTKWGVNRRVKNVKESKGFGLYSWYPGPLDWWIPYRDRKAPAVTRKP